MAKKLKRFPPELGGGMRKYPWHLWTDGGVWEVRQGEDFDIPAYSFQAAVHGRAKTLGVKVRTATRDTEDGVRAVVFQFDPPE